MSEFVSRDSLFEKIVNAGQLHPSVPVVTVGTINVVSTVDAIPVVHCKDCKYLGIKDLGDGYCQKKMAGIISPYDFCSYGERRDDTHE